MVSSAGHVQPDLPGVGPCRGGSLCYQIQQQAGQVCVPNSGPQAWGRCSVFVLGGSGSLCLSSSSSPRKGDQQDLRSLVQEGNSDLIALGWTNMPWLWDLVNLLSQILICLPHQPSLVSHSFNGALHRDLVTLNLHAWLL